MEINHGDKFWIIDRTQGFFYRPDWQERKHEKLYTYEWVIPVWIYSVNYIFDGQLTYDICPVNVNELEKSDHNWQWRRSISKEDIGKEVFCTEEEAWEKYRNEFSEERQKVNREMRRLHFLEKQREEYIET